MTARAIYKYHLKDEKEYKKRLAAIAKALGFRVKGRTVYQSPGKALFTGTTKEVLAYLKGWEHAILLRDSTVKVEDLHRTHLLGEIEVK